MKVEILRGTPGVAHAGYTVGEMEGVWFSLGELPTNVRRVS